MTKWVNFKTVREHLDFRDVLSHYGLKPKGESDQFKIVCPFHDDHKPSCGINRTKQVYHCFSCDAGGNALDFVAHMEGLDPDVPKELRKAAMFAAETFGIDQALERPGKANSERSNTEASKGRAQSRQALKARPKAKQEAQQTDKAGVAACSKAKRSQPSSRPTIANDNSSEEDSTKAVEGSIGDAERVVNAPLTFELKLDPNHKFIDERGFDPKLIDAFGIGYANKGMMHGRICFPIHNGEGELIAYSGRWADDELPEDVPRYLLPKGFEKNRILFNLHRVLQGKFERPELDTVVIVEGFWSVLRLHGEGIPVVSTFGDSVSKAQVELLVRHGFTKATLIFDGDEGGRVGTQSSLPTLAERLFVKAISLEDGVKPDTMDEERVSALPYYA